MKGRQLREDSQTLRGAYNGLLTASEVATLKLNADFVVLSACNTAGDEPGAEALSGLARAFFYAGASKAHRPVVFVMGGLLRSSSARLDKAR